MRDEIDDIHFALGSSDAQRLRIVFDGSEGNIRGDNNRPTDLKKMAAAGYGKYLTDGKTFEALVGYDIANDTRHIVVYRLPLP